MDLVKIYISGSVGSGKTFLAERIAAIKGIPYYNLDPIVWDLDSKVYRKPRDPEYRDQVFKEILSSDQWIVEGGYDREWDVPFYQQADLLIVLKPSPWLRVYRIIIRFIQRKLRLIPDPFGGGAIHLLRLLRWTLTFDYSRLIKRIERNRKSHSRLAIIRSRVCQHDINQFKT